MPVLAAVAYFVVTAQGLHGLVSYETLAKPLSQILTEISPLVHEKVLCADELREDRLLVCARDVDPDELLHKIALAAAATLDDSQSVVRLVPDLGYDRSLLEERVQALGPWHSAWARELASPVRFLDESTDLSCLSELVTPELIKSIGLKGTVRFARPQIAGTREFPAWFPPIYERFGGRSEKYVGEHVNIVADRTHFYVNFHLVTENGSVSGTYSKFYSTRMDSDALILNTFTQPEFLARRFNAARRLSALGRTSGIFPTEDLDAFKAHEWADEPLNALAGPMLLAAAKNAGVNLVAHLSDAVACPGDFSESASFFLGQDIVRAEGHWLVAKPSDPVLDRLYRMNRTWLASLVERARARGYFEVWDLAESLSGAKYLSPGTLRLEAAAIGLVALATVHSAEEGDTFIAGLHRDPKRWAALLAGAEIPITSLSGPDVQALRGFFSSGTYVFATTSSTRNAPDGSVQTSVKNTSAPANQVGFSKSFPRFATLTLTKLENSVLLGIQSDRRYAVVTDYNRYTQAVAFSEAGKGSQEGDALAVLQSFVPLSATYYQASIRAGDTVYGGPRFVYLCPTQGTNPRSLGQLPEEQATLMRTLLKSARDSVKRGGQNSRQ